MTADTATTWRAGLQVTVADRSETMPSDCQNHSADDSRHVPTGFLTMTAPSSGVRTHRPRILAAQFVYWGMATRSARQTSPDDHNIPILNRIGRVRLRIAVRSRRLLRHASIHRQPPGRHQSLRDRIERRGMRAFQDMISESSMHGCSYAKLGNGRSLRARRLFNRDASPDRQRLYRRSGEQPSVLDIATRYTGSARRALINPALRKSASRWRRSSSKMSVPLKWRRQACEHVGRERLNDYVK